ncbi:MAG: glycerophosphodiester phosphodiesterase family protein [Capsulimonadales bacterium]|nr:glycerophosphodiester phosphodiesterase family protein [Capsulimonadales bacterium]
MISVDRRSVLRSCLRGSVFLLALCPAWGKASAQSAPADRPAQWKSDNVLLFLHRSASMAAPENTVPALEAAVRQGADGVEIDIRRTKDGYFVLYHDDWVLEDRGPGGKIEDMPLSEVLTLDVGKRFGPQWKGLRTPLLGDVLRFAKANELLLFLDIKTAGTYEAVLKAVTDAGCLPLVRNVGGQVPKDVFRSPDARPFLRGWNYTDGGEEDPERILAAKANIPSAGCGIMADDARTWAKALGRRPEKRPFVRFSASPSPVRPTVPSPLRRAEPTDRLLTLAETGETGAARLAALWELGRRRDRSTVGRLETLAARPYPEKDGPEHYEKFFLKIGAACALTRIGGAESRAALRRLIASKARYDRASAAFALAAFADRADLPLLIELVRSDPRNDGLVREVVLGYAGRFGDDALPIYDAALDASGFAGKLAVFGLAHRGRAAERLIRSRLADPATPPTVRHRLGLALALLPAR